jgi:hypothetical protein
VTDQRDGPNPAFFSLSGTSAVVLSTGIARSPQQDIPGRPVLARRPRHVLEQCPDRIGAQLPASA